MKKVTAAILVTLYFAFSTGVVINLHYCMNSFDSFKFGATKSEVCGNCGMHTTDSNGCCNDEVKIFKINDDQQVAGIGFKFVSPEALVPQISILAEEILPNNYKGSSINNHSPPLSKQDSYLKNCVFRI